MGTYLPQPRARCLLGVLISILILLLATPTSAYWMPDERLTEDFALSETSPNNAWLSAFDNSGNLHVVWSDHRGGTEGVYHKMHDGISWSYDSRISLASAVATTPAVASDGLGNIHVVWTDHRDGDPEIYYRRYNGVDWSVAVRLSFAPDTSMNPSLAGGPATDLHVVWQDFRDGDWEVYYRTFDGMEWQPSERLTDRPGTSEFPTVAAESGGTVHVAWQDDRDGNLEVYYKVYDGSWDADERLTVDPDVSGHPSVCVDADGGVRVVWEDDRDGNFEIYHKRHDGMAWGAVERLTLDEGTSLAPSIAADDSGGVHVAWYDDRDGETEIYFKTFSSPAWGSDTRLTETTMPSTRPSVTVNSRGDRNVIWQDQRDWNYEIYRKRFDQLYLPAPEILSVAPSQAIIEAPDLSAHVAGANFASPIAVWLRVEGRADIVATDVVVETDQRLSCSFDLADATVGPWDIMVQNPDGRIAVLPGGLTVLPDPVWTPDERLTVDSAVSSPSGSNARCISADSLGGLHIVWHDERDGNMEIYYKHHNGVAWGPDQRLTYASEEASHPSVAAFNDEVHVVWQDNRGEWEICYKHYDGVGWGADQRLTYAMKDSKYPSAAVDGYGNLHVVWQDERGAVRPGIYYKMFDGVGWSIEVCITGTDDPYTTPAVAAGPGNQVHVVFNREQGVHGLQRDLMYMSYDGESWSDQELLFDGGDLGVPAICADPANNVHVVWHGTSAGSYEIYYRKHNGTAWEVTRQISDAHWDSHNPTVAADDDGNVYVVWADRRVWPDRLYFRRFDSTGWGPETRLSAQSEWARFPSCVFDDEDRLHTVWRDERDGNQEIYYRMGDFGVLAGVPDLTDYDFLRSPVRILPNPVRTAASIRYHLASAARTRLTIYDVAGRLIWREDIGPQPQGWHQVSWDTRDLMGKQVAPGIYLLRVEAGARVARAKIVVMM